MLIELGSFTEETKDITLVPFVFDGYWAQNGKQLYKFS